MKASELFSRNFRNYINLCTQRSNIQARLRYTMGGPGRESENLSIHSELASEIAMLSTQISNIEKSGYNKAYQKLKEKRLKRINKKIKAKVSSQKRKGKKAA